MSKLKKITFEMNTEVLDKLKELASKEKQNEDEFIERTIGEAVKRYLEEKGM